MQKEVKKKGKKAKMEQERKKQQQQKQGLGKPGSDQKHPGHRLTVDDIKIETLTIDEGKVTGSEVKTMDSAAANDGHDSDEEKQAVLEEENIQLAEVPVILITSY